MGDNTLRYNSNTYTMVEFIMSITEWIIIISVLDGPILGLLYIMWKRFKYESE